MQHWYVGFCEEGGKTATLERTEGTRGARNERQNSKEKKTRHCATKRHVQEKPNNDPSWVKTDLNVSKQEKSKGEREAQ